MANEQSEPLKIDVERFWRRLDKLFHNWKKGGGSWRSAESFMIASFGQDPIYRKSLALELWLFGYELFNTIFVFCKKTFSLYIVSGQKVASILQQVGEDKKIGENTLKVHFLKKNKENNYEGNVKELLEPMKECGKVTGLLTKEAIKGNLLKAVHGKLKEDFEIVDVSLAIAECLAVKERKEQDIVRTACEFTSVALKKFLVQEIETIIDEEKKVKHSDLASQVEDVFDDPSKVKSDVGGDFLESCYTPIIQSGGVYSLKPSAVSNDNQLHSDGGGTIVVALGARYKSYCSNIARTYFIDPSKEQEKVYHCLLTVYQTVLKHLKDGEKLNKPMEAALAVIKKKKPELLSKFSKNCGFGIGLEFRESSLILNTKNKRVAKSGMVFNICVGFESLHDRDKQAKGNEKAAKYACMIADTVLVTEDEPEKLTHCNRRLKDVSYTLEGDSDSDEQKEEKQSESENEDVVTPPAGVEENHIQRRSRRDTSKSSNVAQSAEAENKRRMRQSHLAKKKQKQNIAKYVEKDGAGYESDEDSEYEDPVSYKSVNQFPRSNGVKIVVDDSRDSILAPLNGFLTPFHISTIKNVNSYEHNNFAYLRINFISPSSSVGRHKKTEKAVTHHADKLWIKEIEYRSKGHESFKSIEKAIKNLSKRVKQREDDNNKENANIRIEPLIIQRDRRYVPRLSQLKIKPNLGGKRKGTGYLEAHQNGFRFTGNINQKVDITYNNIKHAFFQPCDNTVATVLHFELIHPIQVGRKKTHGVQVYYEVIDSSVDIDRRGGGFYDRDGLREEQEERQQRKKWNRNFKDFVKNSEKVIESNKQCKKLEFDIPHKELTFTGVPNKSKVRILPAVSCLVSLEDSPVFVLSLKEVEVAHFERVQFHLRAFDLVFVYKDFKKPVCRIDAIPSKHLENIKEYLTDAGIVFYEGAVNLDWGRIMKEIRDDTRGFFAQGGWDFLDTDENAAAAAGEDGVESAPGSDSDFIMDDASAASDGSADSEEFGSASSEVSEYSDDEMGDSDDEAPSWDDLHRQALEEDRQTSIKTNEDEPRSKKRRKRGRY